VRRPRKRHRTVLVPLDRSRRDAPAIAAALALCDPGGELVLLHVIEPPNPGLLVMDESAGAYHRLQSRHRQAQRQMDRVLERVRGRGRRVRAVVRAGRPVDEILACADAERADLIAMGTRGRTGIGRALLGSVTIGVVSRARLPVLVVNPSARRPAR
jgi:nucleotide-binding universal stress UspA family protein